jgi:hypothetical protein
LVGCRFQIYYREKQKTMAKCAFFMHYK